MRISRALAAVAVAAMTLTACAGTDDADTTDTTAATDEGMEDMDEESMDDMGDDGDMDGMDDESMDDMEGMDDGDMEGMDHSDMDMDMGSADGPRADEVEAAELRQNDLVLLDSAPAPFADASGTAYLALDPMTTLTVDVEGLEPGTEVMLTSGVYGTISRIEDEKVWVVVADGVTLTVAKGAVGQVVQPREVEPAADREDDQPSQDA